MSDYDDKAICALLNVEEIWKCAEISDKLLLVYHMDGGKRSLIATDGKQMKKIGDIKDQRSYLCGIAHWVKNVYAIDDRAVRKQLGCENEFVTITTQGIKDGVEASEFPAVFDFLKERYGTDFLKEQLVEQNWKQILKSAPKGVFSCGQIIDCLDHTNDELLLCRGIKLLKDTYRSSGSYGDTRHAYRAKLFEIINNGEKDKLSVDERDLKGLTGVSLGELEGEQKESVRLALDAYDFSLSDLAWINAKAANEPATALLTEKYRGIYGDAMVDKVVSRADEIAKLPYQHLFFGEVMNNNSAEANFLDEYTKRIKHLAQTKYDEKDEYFCLSNQRENPAFQKDAKEIWNEMFAEADKYAVPRYNWHNNAYVREMFPEQVEQLKQFVDNKYTFENKLDTNLAYYTKVGKMQRVIREYCQDHNCYLGGNLHFDLVHAGVESKKEAKRCLDIWVSANERPDKYGSPYNEYSIAEISKVIKSQVMQDWMYPAMMRAMAKGGFDFNQERMPSERTLFDCCKAWKICPEMPQRLAKQVGKHSLYGRMLAGAIFDKMSESGKVSQAEWRENKNLHVKFYEELSRAEKMKRSDALKQYIPNTVVNRKRLVGAGLEERGIENTPENFRALYQRLRDEKMFDKMLAKPEETRTTISSRLLVEAARRKKSKGR